MNKDAGVIDRLLEICRFARSTMFEAVGADLRSQVEQALSLDQEQLAELYHQLCEGEWAHECATQDLITSCELGLAACLVIKSVLWDIGGLSSYREAEGALQEARSGYLDALELVRNAARNTMVFA